MKKRSAGFIMYRLRSSGIEVFLVHMGGPFWQNKDDGAWSIPKGEFEPDENALEVARREFKEETGYVAEGDFIPLKDRKQPSGKVISAWAFEGDCDASRITSNTFEMEWPKNSGQIRAFPEVDRASWFSIEVAKEKILKGQRPFFDELKDLVNCNTSQYSHFNANPNKDETQKNDLPKQLSIMDFFEKKG